MHADGYMVRWHPERILDVRETYASRFDPEGTEVCYRLRDRRMKPEYEWHPLGRGHTKERTRR